MSVVSRQVSHGKQASPHSGRRPPIFSKAVEWGPSLSQNSWESVFQALPCTLLASVPCHALPWSLWKQVTVKCTRGPTGFMHVSLLEDSAATHRPCTPGLAGQSPSPVLLCSVGLHRGDCVCLWELCLRQTLIARELREVSGWCQAWKLRPRGVVNS